MRKRKGRRVLLIVFALIGAAAAGLYWRAANPTRLRAELTRALAAFGADARRIEDISFTPWGGLTFSGLELMVGGAGADPPTITSGTRVLAPFGRVDLDWSRLLLGEARPTGIHLHSPTIELAAAPDNIVWGSEPGEPAPPASWMAAPSDLPRIEIENADVRVAAGRSGGTRRWLLSAVADYEGVGVARRYVARLSQVGGAALRGRSFLGTRPLVELEWGTSDASVSVAPLSLGAVLLPAPESLRASMRDCDLEGELSVERIELDASGLRRARLRLLNASGAFPVEVDPSSRFLRFRESVVTVDAQRASDRGELTVSIELRGQINSAETTATWRSSGAPVDLWARVRDGDIESMLGSRIDWQFESRGISLPAPSNTAFVESPRLPGPVRAFLMDYLPRGHGALQGRGVTERSTGGEWTTRFDGEMKADDGESRYFRFPYLIDQVQGDVLFSENGVRLDGLGGRHGPGHIWIREGRINNYNPWTGLDLTFEARNLPLNDDLFRALPPGYRPIWESAQPTGVTDATVHLWRDDGEVGVPKEINTEVVARLIAADLSLGDTRLTDASGRVSVRDGHIQLADLRGFNGGAEITVDGDIDLRARDVAAVAVRVLIAGYPIDTAESNLLPGEAPRLIGVADVHGEVTGSLDHRVATYLAKVNDGELTGFSKGPPWRGAHGVLFLGDDKIEVRDLEATRPSGSVRIDGRFARVENELRPVSIAMETTDDELGIVLDQMIPSKWTRLRDALGLSGPGSVRVNLSAKPGGDLNQGRFEISAARMRPGPAPLALRDVTGSVTVSETGFELVNAQARYGDQGTIRASGGGSLGDSDAWSDFSLQAESIDVGQAFVDAMPAALRDMLRRVALSGRIDAAFDRIRLKSASFGTWSVRGRMSFTDASLDLGLPLRDVSGRLDGEVRVEPGAGPALDGTFVADRGTLDGRPFERLEGAFTKRATDEWTRLNDLRARLCDGELFGFARVNADTGAYELNLTLHDMRLASLFPDQGDAESDRPGRVDGQIFLRGNGDVASRRGGGELRIRDASLLGNRVLRSVAEAGRDAPVDEAVEVATMQFAWEGQTLRISNLDVRGASTRFVGEGDWDMAAGTIRLTLFAVGGGPGDPLTKLIDAAGREIMQYDVSGSISSPRVKARPLRNVTEPFRRLLSGD
ncbi:MAG: hypothetical protein KDA32_01275 [Phycisphaerales bacterium]|nr:hypothetical protein [Phycisphaerales bacterium]